MSRRAAALAAWGLLVGCLQAPAAGAAAQVPDRGVARVNAIRVGPVGTDRVALALLLAPGTPPRCAGRVRGTLTFYEAPSGTDVDGELVAGPSGCELPVAVRYDSLPPAVLTLARPDALDLHLLGEWGEGAGTSRVDWQATVPRGAILLTEPMKVAARRFVRVPDLRLGGLGLRTTTVKADVAVTLPLAFDVRVLEARCDVAVNGRKVASGAREKLVLHAGRENAVEVPITVDNVELLAAAGKVALAGGLVEGQLTAIARLRVGSEEAEFQLEAPVRMSLR